MNKVCGVLYFLEKGLHFDPHSRTQTQMPSHLSQKLCRRVHCLTLWSSQVHAMFPLCNEERAYYKHDYGL